MDTYSKLMEHPETFRLTGSLHEVSYSVGYPYGSVGLVVAPPFAVFDCDTQGYDIAKALAVAYTLYHDLKLGKRHLIDLAVQTCNFDPIHEMAKCTARVLARDLGLGVHSP